MGIQYSVSKLYQSFPGICCVVRDMKCLETWVLVIRPRFTIASRFVSSIIYLA